jgi:hypothetical protein
MVDADLLLSFNTKFDTCSDLVVVAGNPVSKKSFGFRIALRNPALRAGQFLTISRQ